MNYENISCPHHRADPILDPVRLNPVLILFAGVVTAAGAIDPHAAPVIGIVTASGHFTVQGSQVWGNSTLFEGATVETASASSELALRNGVKVALASSSRARVFSGHLTIEKGVGLVTAPVAYEVNAAGLRIQTSGPGARVRVGLHAQVEIASLAGSTRISTPSGLVLAALPPGRGINLSMQAAQSGAVTRTGCLLFKDGHFILQDENTQEIVELNGPDLAANTGNRVEIRGTVANTKPAVSIATLVINVSGVSPTSQGGCLSVASLLDAKTEPGTPARPPTQGPTAGTTKTGPPKASGGGMSTGAKVGIVAVIAGGGAGAAIALAGKKKYTSP